MAASACLVLAACSSAEPTEAPEEVEDDFAGQTLSITQTAIPALSNLHVLIAPDNSAQFDLDIEVIPTASAAEYVTGLATGDILVVPGTPSIAWTARDRDIDVVIIGGGSQKSTGIVVATALGVPEGDWDALKSVIEEANDSGDKLSFGGAVAASTNYVMCRSAMEANGIDVENTLQVVDIPAFPEHPAAIERRELDILCTPEPFVTLVVEAGTGTYFAAPFDTPSGDILGAVMTTRESLEDPQKREAIKRWLQTLIYTSDLLTTTDTAVEWVTGALNVSPETATAMVERSAWSMVMDKGQLTALAAQAFALGQTDNDWSQDVDAYLDLSLLEELLN